MIRVLRNVAVLLLFVALPALATDNVATLSGTVSDPTGAVIPGATVVIRGAGARGGQQTVTKEDGAYTLASLPAGRYQIEISSPGFKPFSVRDFDITAGSALTLDAVLALASESTIVEVSANVARLDLSSTQIGDSLSSHQMQSIPVNGRSFTDLLAIEPGIVPTSSSQPNAVVMSGCTNTPPSGDLDPGNLSVSGQRETANGFSVNGSIVEEDFNNGTAVVPARSTFGTNTSAFLRRTAGSSAPISLSTTASGGTFFRPGARNTTSSRPSFLGSNRRSIPERRGGSFFPATTAFPLRLRPPSGVISRRASVWPTVLIRKMDFSGLSSEARAKVASAPDSALFTPRSKGCLPAS